MAGESTLVLHTKQIWMHSHLKVRRNEIDPSLRYSVFTTYQYHRDRQFESKVDALVYARVSLAHKDMEPELECFNADTHKADDFGELKGGFSVKVSLGFARS